MESQSLKNRLTFKNVWSALFVIIVLIILFNPTAKALAIRGLMKVGLFKPDISQVTSANPVIALPEIALQSAGGEVLNLSDQKGKIIFINFWATWCPPCIAEMPSINELREKLKGNKNIVFIMVDTDHNFNRSIPFMDKHHLDLPLYQANSSIPGNILGNVIPTTLIFDKTGKIVFRHEGPADYSNPEMLSYLKQLAKKR